MLVSCFCDYGQVNNRGAVKFRKKGADSCEIKLVISFEVPEPLAPLASGLTPLVDRVLQTDMERFRELATKGELVEFDA